jgi:pimeloyl-ACP methyl ester carboxylesterase
MDEQAMLRRTEVRKVVRQMREVDAGLEGLTLRRRPEEIQEYTELALRGGAVPPYDDSWELRGDFAYEGEFGYGKAFVWYGSGNTRITRPLVLVEGFDPFNEVDYLSLYTQLNADGMVTEARARGFDIVILDFTRGNDYLQRNAFVLVALLERLRIEVKGAAKTVVVGASMGGLIARYALSFMSSKGLDHNTSLFVSFDAPQRGACIPLGLQHFMSYFSRYSGAESLRQQIAKTLDSVASRQMLVYHYLWGGGDNDKAQPDPLRTRMLKELEDYGSYPRGVTKVAVANGSGEGWTLYEARTMLLDWARGGAYGWCYALPHYKADGWDEIFKGWYCGDGVWSKNIIAARPYDGCPGAKRDTIGFVAQQLKALAGGEIKSQQTDHCFIPTVSALDGDDTRSPGNPIINVKEAVAAGTFKTAFDSYIYCERNENHIFISKEITAFLKKAIGITEPAKPRRPARVRG